MSDFSSSTCSEDLIIRFLKTNTENQIRHHCKGWQHTLKQQNILATQGSFVHMGINHHGSSMALNWNSVPWIYLCANTSVYMVHTFICRWCCLLIYLFKEVFIEVYRLQKESFIGNLLTCYWVMWMRADTSPTLAASSVSTSRALDSWWKISTAAGSGFLSGWYFNAFFLYAFIIWNKEENNVVEDAWFN